MPSVPIAMPSVMVGVPNTCGVARRPPSSAVDGGVGQLLQAGVARRDRRVAVGDADHRLVEVGLLVADRVVHRAVRRARDALGDVAASGGSDRMVGLSVRDGSTAFDDTGARLTIGGLRRSDRTRGACWFTRSSSPWRSIARGRPPIAIHWYGLTYLVAFGLFLWLAALRARQPWFAGRGWTRRDVEDLLFFGVLGVVIGGRLGYVLFYKPGYYAAHPLEVARGLEGRHVVPRRPARRARRRWRCSRGGAAAASSM